MKIKPLAILAFAIGATSLAAADWTYTYSEEDNYGQISDGVWAFAATVTDDTIAVNAVTNWPTTVSQLDFSKSVKDVDGNSYTITKLNPLFCVDLENWKEVKPKEAAKYLGELVLPPEGLKTISSGAFGGCSALTNVVNFLPDSVTTLGQAAFMACTNLTGSLYCKNVESFNRCVFYNCQKLKEVTFGSGVRTISNDSNKQGAFQYCHGITNIVFEADCHDIKIKGYAFSGNMNLQPVVLNGVKTVNQNAFANIKSLKSITFDKCIATIKSKIFREEPPNNFSEVYFLGGPPSEEYAVEFFGETTHKITTYVPHKYANGWLPYSATGEINYTDSTFAGTFVTDPTIRPLLWGDSAEATTIVVR